MTDRIKRLNELLRREIAEALYHVVNEGAFEHAAATVTRVEVSRNLHNAEVWVSVRGNADTQARMLRLLHKHRAEIQAIINRDLTIKHTPRLRFTLDGSLERGAHILEILDEVERTLPTQATPETLHPDETETP